MFAVLHERTLAVPRETSAPQLVWVPVPGNSDALKSACGHYSVFRTRTQGQVAYSCARITGDRGLIANHLKSGDEAKKIAQAYANSVARDRTPARMPQEPAGDALETDNSPNP